MKSIVCLQRWSWNEVLTVQFVRNYKEQLSLTKRDSREGCQGGRSSGPGIQCILVRTPKNETMQQWGRSLQLSFWHQEEQTALALHLPRPLPFETVWLLVFSEASGIRSRAAPARWLPGEDFVSLFLLALLFSQGLSLSFLSCPVISVPWTQLEMQSPSQPCPTHRQENCFLLQQFFFACWLTSLFKNVCFWEVLGSHKTEKKVQRFPDTSPSHSCSASPSPAGLVAASPTVTAHFPQPWRELLEDWAALWLFISSAGIRHDCRWAVSGWMDRLAVPEYSLF